MKYNGFLVGLLCLSLYQVSAQNFPLKITENDQLEYVADLYGNVIPDYSYCGYRHSEVSIPDLTVKVFVDHQSGDQSERIQRAIDYVSSLKPDKNGFRGAVLLDKGTFQLESPLRISVSGVVLRGMDRHATILLKKGVGRGAAVYVEGLPDWSGRDTTKVVSDYVPVNSVILNVQESSAYKVGDNIQIVRISTADWIKAMKCNIWGGGIDALGWKKGDIDLRWDRRIVKIDGNQLILDSPLTMALNRKEGDSFVVSYDWKGRVCDSGIENLSIVSEYDKSNPKDEDHCWEGIYMADVRNCWVRKVKFKYLAGSAVVIQRSGSCITVEDCVSEEPVSEIGGMRRQTFLTYGQQTLFQRCYSEHGINDFAVGHTAAGPNSFVQCDTKESLGFSGSVGAWAPGLLFDVVNVDGNNLSFKNLGQDLNGAGWNTANSMFWQCTASELECYSPSEDARNRAYGCWGQFSGDGQWGESNNHVRPRSLFYAQLAARLKNDSLPSYILPMNTSATSSPTVEEAMHWARMAHVPRLTMEAWIEQVPFTASVNPENALPVDKLKFKKADKPASAGNYEIAEGRLLFNGRLLGGARHEVRWWSGKIKPESLSKMTPHITRFVPGLEGLGGTDRIDSVITYMKRRNILVLDHNYGLWYDRRRDDHERIRRRDGEVWAPFYEQPFARSGKGSAWDGLSKYDLTKPDKWYWSRLQEYAAKGKDVGLLLFHENYFQHNIIEAGAHWVDCPWRTANNINQTGFPEPVPFAGDKRIFMADYFYDVNDPVLRALHRGYIRQCMSSLADYPNVVQLVSAEYTGPLSFVQFWLDVIAEWEQETGKKPLIALSATKDVQDAVLSDPVRSKLVDIIDIRYWHYKQDGIFNPAGGVNMAPRQHKRKMSVGKVSFDEVYKAVSEYRSRYPEKVVVYYAQGYETNGWAVLMAGGSCPVLPVLPERFMQDVTDMKFQFREEGKYVKIGDEDSGSIIYSQSVSDIPIHLSPGKYVLKEINPQTGEIKVICNSLKINDIYILKTSSEGNRVYWISRK